MLRIALQAGCLVDVVLNKVQEVVLFEVCGYRTYFCQQGGAEALGPFTMNRGRPDLAGSRGVRPSQCEGKAGLVCHRVFLHLIAFLTATLTWLRLTDSLHR